LKQKIKFKKFFFKDNQTALSIAVENHYRDIGVLIYAHLNFSRSTEVASTSNSSSTLTTQT